jgi:hypothetical protein
MSPNIIDSLRSLEIVCNNLTTPFGKIFDFRERYLQGSDEDGRLASPPAPLFPSLSSLRISFQRLGSPWILDTGVGLPLPVENHLDLLNRLERGLYPTIDKFLDMTVPPTADVTVSSFSYDWYRVLDRKLVEKQGVSITTPQVADIGGIKCWRARTDDYLSEDESSTGSQRKGYWIHLPSPDCLSISGMSHVIVFLCSTNSIH